jgi:hypothetical protein
MEEIAIVRKRSQVWVALLVILLIAAIVLAVLWLMGSEVRTDVGWNGIIELGRRSINGTA